MLLEISCDAFGCVEDLFLVLKFSKVRNYPVFLVFFNPQKFFEKVSLKLPFVYDSNTNGLVDYFTADVKSYSDYYPFGMQLPKRFGREGIEDYRYAFNGMEKDDEVKGSGNSYDFGARMHDPRIGRWLSVDPHNSNYPGYSPYSFVNNTPVNAIDPDGKDVIILIWYPNSSPRLAGHAAIAVENYKQKVDELGNLMFEEILGSDNIVVKKPIMEKDGTYTYYDFWPVETVLKGFEQTNVMQDSDPKQIASLDVLLNTDVSASGKENHISRNGEEKLPETVYRIKTSEDQDKAIKGVAEKLGDTKKYNGELFNCTSFVVESIRPILPQKTANTMGTEEIQVYEGEDEYGVSQYYKSDVNTPPALCRQLFSMSKRTEANKMKTGEPPVETLKGGNCQTQPYLKLMGL